MSVDLTCRECGESLTDTIREVCYTLTDQRFTFDPEGKTGPVYERERLFFEDQRDCFFECSECDTPVTPEQAEEIIRCLSLGS